MVIHFSQTKLQSADVSGAAFSTNSIAVEAKYRCRIVFHKPNCSQTIMREEASSFTKQIAIDVPLVDQKIFKRRHRTRLHEEARIGVWQCPALDQCLDE